MRIVFAGTPDFAAWHLEGLLRHGIEICGVVSQPDKPGKRGKKLIPSAVKKVAQAEGIEVIQPERFTAEDLKPLNPDLLIVVAYGQILRQSLLDTPTHGCINVHASLLPRWRGAAPIQRAIEAGDKETGVCIMQMDAGLDTGPVLLETRTEIAPLETSGTLAERLATLGIEGLLTVITKLQEGELSAVPQSDEGTTYAKKILKNEAKVDWQADAKALQQKIHAFNPDPICFTELNANDKSLRVKLHKVSQVEDYAGSEAPGTIIEVRPEGVVVATGHGAVVISHLQLPLGKGSILSGQDILNSRSDILFPGAQFS